MILLQSTDALRVITSGTPPVDVHASFADLVAATGAVTPGRTNTAISTAATTAVVLAPAAGDALIAARWFDEALPSAAAPEPPVDPPSLPGTNAFWAARRALAVRRR